MSIPRKMEDAVEALIEEELERSNQLFGPFNGPHEAYGVILEEWDEARDYMAGIKAGMSDLRHRLRRDPAPPQWYQALYEDAINAACELIQVAAMGLKGERMAKDAKAAHEA